MDVVKNLFVGDLGIFPKDLKSSVGNTVERCLIPRDISRRLLHAICPVHGLGVNSWGNSCHCYGLLEGSRIEVTVLKVSINNCSIGNQKDGFDSIHK